MGVHVRSAIAIVLMLVSGLAFAKSPECSEWPTNMAFVHLKNAGLTDNALTDPEKATAVRMASEKIGKDLYRQIYQITFHVAAGRDIEVITSSNASSDECSMSEVEVFVVSRHLGGK